MIFKLMVFVIAMGATEPQTITLPPDYPTIRICERVAIKILHGPLLFHAGTRYHVIAASCARRVDI